MVIQKPLIKTILSLCDFSGVWSAPYREAGYNVIQIDLQRDGQDVRLMEWSHVVHGVLAAPPCTVFCRAGAWLWPKWGNKGLLHGLSIVDACLRIITVCQPAFWALENPPGRLDKYLGPPSFSFQPWEFGDPWTKQTYLWGNFSIPRKAPVESEPYPEHLAKGSRDRTTRLSSSQKNKRAETPAGFAKAFFEANQ